MKESLVSVAFQLHLFSHFEAVSRSVHVQHNPFSFPSKVESQWEVCAQGLECILIFIMVFIVSVFIFIRAKGTRWVSPFRELTLKNCIQGNAHSCTQQIHCRFKFLYVQFLSCSAEDFETLATFSGFVECCDAVFAMKRVDYKTSSDLLRAFRVVDNGWISISDTAVS